MEILSPGQLWQDYDRNIPFDETLIKEGENGRIKYLYFNGYSCKDSASLHCGKIRIYAKLVLPKKQPENKLLPALIYAGKMSRDIDSIDVSYFVDAGYAVLVVDYAGDTGDKSRYTLYPREIDAYWQSNHEKIKEPRALKNCCWYYWTTCIIHAATYLEKCGLVDKNKIGFFGSFEAAPLVFKSSAVDLIKCGTTFFGGDAVNGNNYYAGATGGFIGGAPGMGGTAAGAMTGAGMGVVENMGAGKANDNEEMLTYKAALDSRAYAKTAYPILINATTNSRNNSFDFLSELYESSPRSAFCVCQDADEAVSGAQRGNILPWFNHILEGKAVNIPRKELAVFGSGGAVYAEVETTAEKVEIYYAEDGPPACRHFKKLLPSKVGENKYLAKLDIFDTSRAVLVFANITEGGFTLTTPVVARQPAKLGAIKNDTTISRLIFQCDEYGEDGEEEPNTGFLRPDGGFLERKKLRLESGPLGLSGLKGNQLVTFKPGDSKFKAQHESLLQLTVSSKEAQEIEIYTIDCTGVEYSCCKKITAGQWTTLSLSGADFKSVKGSADFSLVAGIKIKGRDVLLNSMLWV